MVSLSQQEYLNEKTMPKALITRGSIIVTDEYYFMVVIAPATTDRL